MTLNVVAGTVAASRLGFVRRRLTAELAGATTITSCRQYEDHMTAHLGLLVLGAEVSATQMRVHRAATASRLDGDSCLLDRRRSWFGRVRSVAKRKSVGEVQHPNPATTGPAFGPRSRGCLGTFMNKPSHLLLPSQHQWSFLSIGTVLDWKSRK